MHMQHDNNCSIVKTVDDSWSDHNRPEHKNPLSTEQEQIQSDDFGNRLFTVGNSLDINPSE